VEETGEMLYLSITNILYTSNQSQKAGFIECDLIPNSGLHANNIDACISVHVCPPLMAVCHKAATASNLTGQTGRHCCLPPDSNGRQRRCRASGEGLQRDRDRSSS